jgi:hypothetical protein
VARKVPIELKDPNAPTDNAHLWKQLNQQAGGNKHFTPVEIKSFYVIGLIYDICTSVEWLLRAEDAWPQKYLPAFGVFASAVDLLGRCLTGNEASRMKDNLQIGFYYLLLPTNTPCPKLLPAGEENKVVVRTAHAPYSISALVALRHYTAHGQATVRHQLPGVDSELLRPFPKMMGDAIDAYWEGGLKGSAEYCSRIGAAKLDPYSNRVEPLKQVYRYFSVMKPAGSMFRSLDWSVRV